MKKEIDVNKPDKKDIRNIVVKIGSSVICADKQIAFEKIQNLVKQFIKIRKLGIKIVIVTSGAIAAGMGKLDLKMRPRTLPGLQAAAATGQSKLMALYDKAFSSSNVNIAQVLLTREDMHERNRYLNARNTLMKLLEYDILPIVNENDTVAVDEIKFGDNDTLSALVAALIDTDWLIILSDIKGVYIPNSKIEKYKRDMVFYNSYTFRDKNVVKCVKKIPDDMGKVCQGASAATTVGGVSTKIQASQIVANCGIPCTVADGEEKDVLLKILNRDDIGTYFSPATKKKCAKKRWIGYGTHTKGKIVVDEGAKGALVNRGKSLLSSGIIKIEGDFLQGDVVAIVDNSDNIFAKGLTYYSSEELIKIKGKKTDKIESILGIKYYDEVINRDNLVLL